MTPLRLRDALLTEREVLRDCIPLPDMRITGVYFLVKAREIVYVGQSTDILRRVGEHRRSGRVEFEWFAYQECGADDLDVRESYYIHAFRPHGNFGLNGKRRELLAPMSAQRADSLLGRV